MIYQYKRYIQFQAEYERADIIQTGGMSLLLKNGLAYTPNNSYGGPMRPFSFIEFKEVLKAVNADRYKIRFSPWLENYKYFPTDKIKYSRQTIARDLTQPVKFGHGLKWSIKQGIKKEIKLIKLVYPINELDVYEFTRIYNLSMKRVNSEKCYQYTIDYFKTIFDYLKESIEMLIVESNSGVKVAAAIFLLDNDIVHYYFSGYDSNYKEYYPMDILLSEAIKEYKERGFKLFHLGGGLQDGDSLFNFKKKFGNILYDYYIAEGEV